jgi:hypothetical protein
MLLRVQEHFVLCCLRNVWSNIDTLKEKLSVIKEVSFFSFKDDKNVEDKVKQLKAYGLNCFFFF